MDGRGHHHHHKSPDENERKSSKTRHSHHKAEKNSAGAAAASKSSPKGRRHEDSSSPSRTKPSTSHSHGRHDDPTTVGQRSGKHSDHARSPFHEDAQDENVYDKSRRHSNHVKSSRQPERDRDPEEVFRKASYIPSESATSPQDKIARIEKWRQDGARCLLQKQETEAALRAMYSRQHEERRRRPELSEQRAVSFEQRRHKSHHGRVESNEPSAQSSVLQLEEKVKQKVATFMAKSLHSNLEDTMKWRKTARKLDSNSEMSLDDPIGSGKVGNSRPLISNNDKSKSSLKSSIAKSKGSNTYNSKFSLAPPSTFSEPKKLELQTDYSTLKIKNLPLSLTLNDLKSLFPESSAITLPMKQFGMDEESQMSIGQAAVNPTAYVKFRSKQDAAEILKHFQGLKIRGHSLKISVDYQHKLE